MFVEAGTCRLESRIAALHDATNMGAHSLALLKHCLGPCAVVLTRLLPAGDLPAPEPALWGLAGSFTGSLIWQPHQPQLAVHTPPLAMYPALCYVCQTNNFTGPLPAYGEASPTSGFCKLPTFSPSPAMYNR
jgi:hypothetical protein